MKKTIATLLTVAAVQIAAGIAQANAQDLAQMDRSRNVPGCTSRNAVDAVTCASLFVIANMGLRPVEEAPLMAAADGITDLRIAIENLRRMVEMDHGRHAEGRR